jgi:hypothetical protein
MENLPTITNLSKNFIKNEILIGINFEVLKVKFKQGQTTEAISKCEVVLIFARTRKNRLRLVEATLTI